MVTERGQALLELAVGLFAIVLVVSVLTSFAVGIARALEDQNSLRTTEGASDYSSWRIENKVDLGDLWKMLP